MQTAINHNGDWSPKPPEAASIKASETPTVAETPRATEAPPVPATEAPFSLGGNRIEDGFDDDDDTKPNLGVNTPPMKPHFRTIPIASKPETSSPPPLEIFGLCAALVCLLAFVMRRQWAKTKKKPAHFIV
jgi:hypothetical protein